MFDSNKLLDNLLTVFLTYNEKKEVETITKAFNFANELHKNQFRKSGDPYIIHPYNVAMICAKIFADADSICTSLLHDTVEDCGISIDTIENMFGKVVASLVNDLTKLSKTHFVDITKKELTFLNTRRLYESLLNDIRFMIVKLADRLHNMRTLNFMSVEKQIENAEETMEIFAPIAKHLGMYKIKRELEDLSFKYLYPKEYEAVVSYFKSYLYSNIEYYKSIKEYLSYIFKENGIDAKIVIRYKNLYRIFWEDFNAKSNSKQDIINLKILVNDEVDCYKVWDIVKQKIDAELIKERNYIYEQKKNGYKAIHLHWKDENCLDLFVKIATHKMHLSGLCGVAYDWALYKGIGHIMMKKDFKKTEFSQFLERILVEENLPDKAFVECVSREATVNERKLKN